MCQQICEFLRQVWAKCDAWALFGFIGQGVFTARFVYQWIVSEQRKESIIPIGFWYLSIIGSLILLLYSIHRKDPVYILAFSFNTLIYARNLMLIYRKKPTVPVSGAASSG